MRVREPMSVAAGLWAMTELGGDLTQFAVPGHESGMLSPMARLPAAALVLWSAAAWTPLWLDRRPTRRSAAGRTSRAIAVSLPPHSIESGVAALHLVEGVGDGHAGGQDVGGGDRRHAPRRRIRPARPSKCTTKSP